MQEKESIMVLRRKLKFRHPDNCSVMPNSYTRDGIFNQHLTTIKDAYIFSIGLILRAPKKWPSTRTDDRMSVLSSVDQC